MIKKTGLADSPFFKPPIQAQEVFSGQSVLPSSERNSERTENRSENRTPTLPTKRRTTRYSFEFYEDQIRALKRLKYEAEMSGTKVNLSDFAREALDFYLRDKTP